MQDAKSVIFLERSTSSSLSSLIKDQYSDGKTMLEMRFFKCNFGGNKLVSSTTKLVASPDILIVYLLRFPYYDQGKVTSIVVPKKNSLHYQMVTNLSC